MTRFRVGSVTGWLINQRTPSRAGDSRRTPTVIWYVADSADCFHTVREFRAWGGKNAEPEQAARAFADQLNREYP
jgi:hypothetical protein